MVALPPPTHEVRDQKRERIRGHSGFYDSAPKMGRVSSAVSQRPAQTLRKGKHTPLFLRLADFWKMQSVLWRNLKKHILKRAVPEGHPCPSRCNAHTTAHGDHIVFAELKEYIQNVQVKLFGGFYYYSSFHFLIYCFLL